MRKFIDLSQVGEACPIDAPISGMQDVHLEPTADSPIWDALQASSATSIDMARFTAAENGVDMAAVDRRDGRDLAAYNPQGFGRVATQRSIKL